MSSRILTRTKAQKHLEEDDKEEAKEERQPKKVNQNPTKGKREEVANKEKLLELQSTIEKSIGARTRTTGQKNIESHAPMQGQGTNPSSIQ